MLGIGGIFAEVLDDVVFCRAPASPEAVRAALGAAALTTPARRLPRHAGGRIATRSRRSPPACRRSWSANPSIVEVDLNPVIADARRCGHRRRPDPRRGTGGRGSQGMSAVIIGTGEAGYTRHPEPGQNTHTFLRDAVVDGDPGCEPHDCPTSTAWRSRRSPWSPTRRSTWPGASACRCAGCCRTPTAARVASTCWVTRSAASRRAPPR